MSENQFYLIDKDNAVHQFLLDNLKENRKVIHVEGNAKSLAQYRFKGLQEGPSLLIIENLKTDINTTRAISRISTHNRIIVFSTKNNVERQFIRQIDALQHLLGEWGEYKTWESKETLCTQFLEEYAYAFQTSTVYKKCIQLIIRDFKRFSQYLKDIRLLVDTDTVITENHLNEIFHDTEIFPLDKWVLTFLKGMQPRKTVQGLSYFLHVKRYNSEWLYYYMFKWLQTLIIMYDAQKEGIFYNLNVQDNFIPRATLRKVPYLTTLKSLSIKERSLAIDFVATVPLHEFYKIQRAFLSKPHITESELHQLFLLLHNLQQLRGSE